MLKQNTSTFQGVLRKLEAWQNPKVDSCERRSNRYPVRCDARLISENLDGCDESAEQIVQIRDVSRTGAGLLCSAPVEVGTRWRLEPASDGMALASLPAFCRFCRRVEEGVYLIGVEFGIEASIMIAIGVSAAELQHDEVAGNHSDSLNAGQFVDPSELFEEDAA